MEDTIIDPNEGDFFEGVLLETCRDVARSITRPRVRPVEMLPSRLRVEFPRHLRDDNPIGTRFRADVHVRQKHFGDGSPNGDLYLRAENQSIRKITDYQPKEIVRAIRRNSVSGRAYFYIRDESTPQLRPSSFDELRRAVIAVAASGVSVSRSEAWRRERGEIVREYALLRSSGKCDGCEKPAPFLSRNGSPYLEVHHIIALANGGIHHPSNLAAVCPNCHTRVIHGKDGNQFNAEIQRRVTALENALNEQS